MIVEALVFPVTTVGMTDASNEGVDFLVHQAMAELRITGFLQAEQCLAGEDVHDLPIRPKPLLSATKG